MSNREHVIEAIESMLKIIKDAVIVDGAMISVTNETASFPDKGIVNTVPTGWCNTNIQIRYFPGNLKVDA